MQPNYLVTLGTIFIVLNELFAGMRVKLVPCNRDGTVDAATLKKYITSQTALVSFY